MLPLLVLLFVAVPIVELYLILQVGQWLGVLPTVALLVADSVLGSLLMRSQGRSVWRRFNAGVASGRPPAREVIDGALVIFGGALLLTPGFATDLLGLLLLLPPTRAVIRGLLVRRLLPRMAVRVVGGMGPRRRPPRDHEVDGTAADVDPRPSP